MLNGRGGDMKRPEKMVQTKEEDNSDWFYGYGYNQAIEESDSYYEELLGGLKEAKDDLVYEVQHISFCDCKYCKIIKKLETIIEGVE